MNRIFDMKFALVIPLFVLISFFPSQGYAQEKCLNVGYWDVINHKVFINVIQKTYKAAGLCAKLMKLPLKRAEVKLVNAEIDANGWRSMTFIDKFRKDILYIEEPFFTVVNRIIYNPEKISEFAGDNAFRNAKIGSWRGDVDSESKIRSLGANPLFFSERQKLVDLFNIGRIDAFFLSSFEHNIRTLEEKIQRPYGVKTLNKMNYHHVLSKKNQQYLEKLNIGLKKSKELIFTKPIER